VLADVSLPSLIGQQRLDWRSSQSDITLHSAKPSRSCVVLRLQIKDLGCRVWCCAESSGQPA